MAIDNIELNTADTPPYDSFIKIGPSKKFQVNKRNAEADNEIIDIFKDEKRLFEISSIRITIKKAAK